MIARTLRTLAHPDAAFARLADAVPSVADSLRRGALLACIPALGWVVGLALGVNAGVAFMRTGVAGLAVAGLASWLLAVATLALLAGALWLIAPMYDAPRSCARALAVAVNGALPLLAGGILLALPGGALLTVVALALSLLHWAAAARHVLPIAADQVPECIAIALLLVSAGAMLMGGVIGALHLT